MSSKPTELTKRKRDGASTKKVRFADTLVEVDPSTFPQWWEDRRVLPLGVGGVQEEDEDGSGDEEEEQTKIKVPLRVVPWVPNDLSRMTLAQVSRILRSFEYWQVQRLPLEFWKFLVNYRFQDNELDRLMEISVFFKPVFELFRDISPEIPVDQRFVIVFRVACRAGRPDFLHMLFLAAPPDVEKLVKTVSTFMDEVVVPHSSLSEVQVRKTMEYLLSIGTKFSRFTAQKLTKKGFFDTLRWAHTNACPLSMKMMDYAARSGRLDILDWAHDKGQRMADVIYTHALRYPDPRVLNWLDAHDQHPAIDPTVAAARTDHVVNMKWLVDKGYRWNPRTAVREAVDAGRLHMLKYLMENGGEWTFTSAALMERRCAKRERGAAAMSNWLRGCGYPVTCTEFFVAIPAMTEQEIENMI